MTAYIKYRETTTPVMPVVTEAKGTPLTNNEVDGNFKSLASEIELKADITYAQSYTNAAVFAAATTSNDTAIAMSIALG